MRIFGINLSESTEKATWTNGGLTCPCGSLMAMTYASRVEGIGGREVWEIHPHGYTGTTEAWACRKCGRIFYSWDNKIGGFPVIGQAAINENIEPGEIFTIEGIDYHVLDSFEAEDGREVMLVQAQFETLDFPSYGICVLDIAEGIGGRKTGGDTIHFYAAMRDNRTKTEANFIHLANRRENPIKNWSQAARNAHGDRFERKDPLTEGIDIGTTFYWKKRGFPNSTRVRVIDSYESNQGTDVAMVKTDTYKPDQYGICSIRYAEGIGGRRIRSNEIVFFGGEMYAQLIIQRIYDDYKKIGDDPTDGYHESFHSDMEEASDLDLTEDIETGDVFHTPRGGDVRIQAIYPEPIMAYIPVDGAIEILSRPGILVVAFVYIPGLVSIRGKNAFYSCGVLRLIDGIGGRQVIDTSRIYLPWRWRFDDVESAIEQFESLKTESHPSDFSWELDLKEPEALSESESAYNDSWWRLICPCGCEVKGYAENIEGIGGRTGWYVQPKNGMHNACLMCGRIFDPSDHRMLGWLHGHDPDLDEPAPKGRPVTESDETDRPEYEYMVYRGDGTYCSCGSKRTIWATPIQGIGNRVIWDAGYSAHKDPMFIACSDCGRIAEMPGTLDPETRWLYYRVIDQSDSVRYKGPRL